MRASLCSIKFLFQFMQYDVETRLEVIGSSNYQKKNHRTETFDFNEKSFCIRLDVYMRNIYAEF